jgi:hypothetical protein
MGGDNLTGGTFAFADRHVGTGKTVNVSGVVVNDGNGGNNYTLTQHGQHRQHHHRAAHLHLDGRGHGRAVEQRRATGTRCPMHRTCWP